MPVGTRATSRASGWATSSRKASSASAPACAPWASPSATAITAQAAKDLGLTEGTPVGVSIIDAHAGGLGLLGAKLGKQKVGPATLGKRIALIGGTSSCHMAASPDPRYIKGVWGPYHSAMIPGLWLTEGGQSAVGALLDHIIFNHPAAAELQAEADKTGQSIFDVLNDRIDAIAEAEGCRFPGEITRELHIQPRLPR